MSPNNRSYQTRNSDYYQRFSDLSLTHTNSILAAQAGDPNAEDRFYRRYYAAVLCYFQKIIGQIQEVEAEDLTQDFFLVLLNDDFQAEPPRLRLLNRYNRAKGGLRNWMKKLIQRKKIDFWRKRAHAIREQGGHLRSPDCDFSEGPPIITKSSLTAEEEPIYWDFMGMHSLAVADVAAACAEDTECPYRFEMFRMHYLATPSMDWPEIAQEFNLTRDKARNWTLTALNWYRNALYDDLQDQGFWGEAADNELKLMLAILGKRSGPERMPMEDSESEEAGSSESCILLNSAITQPDLLAELQGICDLQTLPLILGLQRRVQHYAIKWSEIAIIAGVPEQTIDRWRKTKELPDQVRMRLAALLVVISLALRERLGSLADETYNALVAALRGSVEGQKNDSLRDVFAVFCQELKARSQSHG